MYDWVQEHRAHHKLRNTDYDKFDYRKGFTFAHILSHCINVDPRITKEEQKVDMSDIEQDPIVMYQKRFELFYYLLIPIIAWVWLLISDISLYLFIKLINYT